jgi:hypothetical protein
MPRISFFGLKAAGSNVMGSISCCPHCKAAMQLEL